MSAAASAASAGSESPSSIVQMPASPGPYSHGHGSGVGPTAVLQMQHGHFLITMSVTTTFPPSAVLPTVYSLLPTSQLQCDHIDIQVDEKTHKMRVQVVGVVPPRNPHAVTNLATRMKSLQPGASVTVQKELTQLSVDADSIAAFSSLLMSSQSRAMLDQHIHYYRLHSHPAFVPSLLIYIATARVDHVLNIMRNFMADPVAGGAVRPPRPSGMEVKGEDAEADTTPTPSMQVTVTPPQPATTPEKTGLSLPPRAVQSSSRSPHFKPKTNSATMPTTLPSAGALDSAVSVASVAGTSTSEPSSSAADVAAAIAAAADDHDGPAPGAATSVGETQEIRIDNKWWSSQRAELLMMTVRHSLSSDSLYVYSLPEVRANVARLRSLTAVNRVFYACKANHNPDVLRAIEAGGIGFECVSIQELKYVRDLFPSLSRDRLLFTPNFAAKIEYEEAYCYTDQVNLDNIYPLEHWPEIFRNKPVLLRVDPGHGLGYHAKMQTGGARSKFGVSVEQLEASLPLIKSLGIRVVGLHVHKGSGIHVAETWSRTAAFLAQSRHHFPDLRVLDLGGGLGVNYRDSDPTLDLAKLNESLIAFRASVPGGDQLELWLEPGRFVVASAGVLLSPVTQLKSKPGRSFVGLATGMNSLIRPALYESYHEIVNLSRLGTDPTRTDADGSVWLTTRDESTHSLVDVVGPICETGDVLGHARSLPTKTAEGDIILVDTAGAYGRVMSSEYNLRRPAKEIVLQ